MKRNVWEQKLDQAVAIPDRVERLSALENLRLEIGMYGNWKDDQARALLGRTDRGSDEWGPLTIAIHQAKNALRLPPKRSDWRRRTSVTNSEPHRLLQDARSFLYNDDRFWDRLAHKASVAVDARLQTATLEKKPKSTVVTHGEWVSF